MHFRIQGLPAEQFAPLFSLSDEELAASGAVRRIADDRNPGYPCRVSLADSNPGDELILVNHEHHAVDSPYRMRFAIYVRAGDKTFDAVDTVPDQLRARMLAVRAFDAGAMMIGHALAMGRNSNPRSRNCSPTRERPICTSTSLRPAVTPRASIARSRASSGASADQPKRARGDQSEAGHGGGDILERAQQKCSAQRPERLRLLIPGHRRYVPEKAPPQAEGHGKNDQSENKELECGADRHWNHSSRVTDASNSLVRFEHDLVRKPASTFRDHALTQAETLHFDRHQAATKAVTPDHEGADAPGRTVPRPHRLHLNYHLEMKAKSACKLALFIENSLMRPSHALQREFKRLACIRLSIPAPLRKIFPPQT
jgi:Protein of unknown function (DUF1203)